MNNLIPYRFKLKVLDSSLNFLSIFSFFFFFFFSFPSSTNNPPSLAGFVSAYRPRRGVRRPEIYEREIILPRLIQISTNLILLCVSFQFFYANSNAINAGQHPRIFHFRVFLDTSTRSFIPPSSSKKKKRKINQINRRFAFLQPRWQRYLP